MAYYIMMFYYQYKILLEKIYLLNLYIIADSTTAPIPNPTYFRNPLFFSFSLTYSNVFSVFMSANFISGSLK